MYNLSHDTIRFFSDTFCMVCYILYGFYLYILYGFWWYIMYGFDTFCMVFMIHSVWFQTIHNVSFGPKIRSKWYIMYAFLIHYVWFFDTLCMVVHYVWFLQNVTICMVFHTECMIHYVWYIMYGFACRMFGDFSFKLLIIKI